MAGGTKKAWVADELTGAAGRVRVRRQDAPAKRNAHACFDVVGDVHGCLVELLELLKALGYGVKRRREDFAVIPPQGRKLAFVGDLVDRGPAAPGVLRLVMDMARAGTALCVAGNRDVELVRAMRGRVAEVSRGMARTLEQLAAQPKEFRAEVARFLRGLPSQLMLDAGRLVVAHAGLKEAMQGRASAEARAFALHGEVTGERDAAGLPIAQELGSGVSRQGAGGAWAHAGVRARVVEQYGQSRYRVRVRRASDGAALPGARDDLDSGQSDLLRAAPDVCRQQDPGARAEMRRK